MLCMRDDVVGLYGLPRWAMTGLHTLFGDPLRFDYGHDIGCTQSYRAFILNPFVVGTPLMVENGPFLRWAGH